MELLPCWCEKIETIKEKKPTGRLAMTKPQPQPLPEIINVSSEKAAERLVKQAYQASLSHIGISVIVAQTENMYDPKSIMPFTLALAISGTTDEQPYCAVLDLKKAKILPIVSPIFQLPVCFVGHDLRQVLFALWQHQLPEPAWLWDTLVCEKATHLGKHHRKYQDSGDSNLLKKIRLDKENRAQDEAFYSLAQTCLRYALTYPLEPSLQKAEEVLVKSTGLKTFTSQQLKVCIRGAAAAAELYPLQVCSAARHGFLSHLFRYEMPWVITGARIQWHGARLGHRKSLKAKEWCEHYLREFLKSLSLHYDIDDPSDHGELEQFFRQEHIIHLFKNSKELEIDRKALKRNKDAHPAISLILAVQRVQNLLNSEIFKDEILGMDKRFHPTYHQFGTHTGRLTSQNPSIMSLDSLLRSLIIPAKGCGIGEADWSQIEVGIAAAVYHDEELMNLFNTGDVYSAMAKLFFEKHLAKEDQELSSLAFKIQHKDLRNRMKVCILGLINGMTPVGIAEQLGCNAPEAKLLHDRFGSMFPKLHKGMDKSRLDSEIKGYASTITNLHRYRGKQGEVLPWEKRWFANHPVQGTAATIFKATGNRLDKLYRQYDARIIVPLHDAFVFEAPLEVLEKVGKLTSKVMVETVQEFFPELRPKVELNISHPRCWNKDGNRNALSKWLKEVVQA